MKYIFFVIDFVNSHLDIGYAKERLAYACKNSYGFPFITHHGPYSLTITPLVEDRDRGHLQLL